ncbi:hypothetical protein [Campylobacter porcelli]|uniref:Nitrate reductase accessory protein n=1 Tax=Campylobacter porcelli TaxID=1660073 RepID=A0A1X9SWZ3_9BACT|nr:hypothetical protein [Campylobacter sp. RM6137]ARR00792.1 nitrate reductase accessory protein [Campylobacter sp. RM6137]MEE3776235.1 hypothetical protein [Campylobacter sp. CX2-4080-23]
MRFFVVLFMSIAFLWADFELKLPANSVSIKLDNNSLLIGLDNGELYNYDIKSKELNKIIDLPKFSNYFDNDVAPKIFSIDKLGDIIAILYESDNGAKSLGIIQNGNLKSFKMPTDGVKKIFLLDSNHIIFVTLSSEVEYYDFKDGKVVFNTKLSTSSTGDAAYDRKSGILVTGIEGGVIFYFDTKLKKLIKQINAQKDTIYSVGLNEKLLISGSADKKAYFNNGSKEFYYDAKFLVYCVGVNSNNAAFSTENMIKIIDKSGKIVKDIEYNGASLNNLIFSSEYLIGSSYDNKIYFWSVE